MKILYLQNHTQKYFIHVLPKHIRKFCSFHSQNDLHTTSRSLGIRCASSSCHLLRKCLPSICLCSGMQAFLPQPSVSQPLLSFLLRSSLRPISDSQLHTLLYFHLCPIYLVVFKGSYCFRMGYLILRGASRLDAFSVYPVPAWLFCYELGSSTDSPAASPSRSSRTKDSSSQISYAHAG